MYFLHSQELFDRLLLIGNIEAIHQRGLKVRGEGRVSVGGPTSQIILAMVDRPGVARVVLLTVL